jgi:hypothetical protein
VRLRKRTYSIPEVAALTGLTVDAVRGRLKRGSLASIVKDGRRRIPHAELARAGLLPPQPENSAADVQAGVSLPEPLSPASSGAGAALVAELLDRLERQSVELAHYRALEAASGNARLLQELAHLRARVAALEGAPEQRALSAGGEAGLQPSPQRSAALTGPTERSRLWLPPTAGMPPSTTHAGPPPVAASRQPLTLPTLRAGRFAVEALLILGAALGSWLAGFDALGIILVVGAVWLIVALAELVAWQLETR